MLHLLNELRKGVEIGNFDLSSGDKSNYYINLKKKLLDGSILQPVCKEILARTEHLDITAVGGVLFGAAALVYGMLALSHKPLKGVLIRKEPKQHGMLGDMEGVLTKDDRILVVDDVITTGNSLLNAYDKMQSLASVVAVFAVVDRSNGKVKLPVSVFSMFNGEELC